jgi:hypothetical protein
LSLSKKAGLREDAAARVGAAPKRPVEVKAETRSTLQTARVSSRAVGPSLLDHAVANIGHIRTDLTRIAVLAVVMVSVIVVLSFLLA